MTGLIPFAFEDAPVRATLRDGEPWFVLADVCVVLEISKHRDAASRMDDDERGSVIVDTPGGPQQTTIINESGLYTLILTSRKPEAKRFRKWVTSEVLPSIRKTGGYADHSEAGSVRRLSLVLVTLDLSGLDAALPLWAELKTGMPMPDRRGLIALIRSYMSPQAGGQHEDGRPLTSRHNGALDGRPRKGETAEMARTRRLQMVDKVVIPSDDGQSASVITYSTVQNPEDGRD
ncbi:BRO-N domain-containing protein [Acetobacter oeni]|uniref:Bro-N domain-containing protein n=1 Tax=Acetobacter oeni TaxID=304077 RepID=A0A511XKZ5_9PROT|nr:Bro-N domain-containing protein [Acetobacter oeni]MBB3885011.1 prophage antirepressor-like protein [Acetobacter oeni]NHO19828.1 hypothetical protein [Acetobacter oeni]GBR08874.1 prophage antirepressor [Acetobacter oeni LMG 21952]GEN63584.1 hypothetical protein AOE01nite_18080 [Acetobacter oeni]